MTTDPLLASAAMADPAPHLRCRCVLIRDGRPPAPYTDRCTQLPTDTDGLCEHCRSCDATCSQQCCARPGGRVLVDLTAPCQAVEVPF